MELLVLNTDFESIAVIDTYESMIWTDRYNSYGDFEIFFAMDTQLLQYLKEDYYLWLKDSEHCMIIEDIKINADTEEGNHLIVTGRSLESILERRIIWGQRIFNGNLQNGIQTMLNECIISPSTWFFGHPSEIIPTLYVFFIFYHFKCVLNIII